MRCDAARRISSSVRSGPPAADMSEQFPSPMAMQTWPFGQVLTLLPLQFIFSSTMHRAPSTLNVRLFFQRSLLYFVDFTVREAVYTDLVFCYAAIIKAIPT